MSGEFGKKGGAPHMPSQRPVYVKPEDSFDHIASKEKFHEFYNKLGTQQNQMYATYDASRMDVFLPYVRGSVIELGCQNGMNFVKFLIAGATHITGVDCSDTFISLASGKYKNSPVVTLINSFIEDLSEDKKYDTVVLTETLEHVIDPDVIIKKVKNILADNGYLLYSAPEHRVGSSSHVRGITEKEIIELFKKYGLSVYVNLPRLDESIRLIAQHEK
jgi:2-polyprenyl-3-methyl-5-hydroxy-6-metoxy-1,4-benzoquinol methylase